MRLLMAFFAALPLRFHYFNARWIAFLLYKVFRYRRDVVMTNLSRSFPDRKYDELERICRDFYSHLALVMVEAIWFGGCNAKRLKKADIARVYNPELLKELYDEAPSTIILEGHFGNWEMSGGIMCFSENYAGSPVNEQNYCVIYKALSNRYWNKIFRRNRTSPLPDAEHYRGYIESKDILRFMVRHKDEKYFYKLIADQSPHAGDAHNIGIEFLNQKTQVMTASAEIAHRLGTAVVYSSMMRESRGHYGITYHLICKDASTISVEDIMKRFYALLENDIIAQPESYLWSHKRWKL